MSVSAFDTVVLQGADGPVELSVAAFLELPLSQRIRHLIDRTVTFRRGGVEVDRAEALAALRRARAA